jgi:anaerobic magnesium-protoporphyrin IX monomethyl ester cyclase
MIDRNRVLLLQAPVPGSHNRIVAKSSAIPPLGLGYLASVLLKNGFDVRISDMDVEDVGVEELKQMLFLFSPNVVGISSTTLTFKNALRVAKVVKQCLPECLICLGGPHVSVNYYEALSYPYVDLVVRGEGELTFLDVCQSVAKGADYPIDIAGTVIRSEGCVITLPERARIRNLDDLPFPARHLMPLHLYNIPGTILTSRGCPFECGFCAGPVVLGRRYVARSAENVVSEVKMCIDLFGLTSFYFVDDTITHDTERLMDICEGLRQLDIPPSLGRKLKWTCESRADAVNIDILREMKKAGCTTIQFGMESGSQELLDLLGKRVTLKQIEQAVVWSRQEGISPVLSMVFPHPDETEETLKQTFNFIRKLYAAGAEKVIPALLTLFPGTRFMEERGKLGLNLLTYDTDEYNLGTPILTTRNLDKSAIVNGYTQLLLLTQILGGEEIGGIRIDEELLKKASDATFQTSAS